MAPVRARKQPPTPSRQEAEDHEATHYPYRTWCRACVAAAGRRDSHAAVAGDTTEDGISCVACDYGFFTDKEDTSQEEAEKTHAPILVCRDGMTQATFADIVHAKGAAAHVAKRQAAC